MKELIPDNVVSVSLRNRPIAVPYNYRITYKIAQISLIIHFCCGKKSCSLEKIHIVSNALSSHNEMIKLLKYIDSDFGPFLLVRFDPSINRAIDFALAEGIFVRQKNCKFKVSEKGSKFLTEIVSDSELFMFEKMNLKSISTRITDEKIDRLISNWGTSNA